jgi:hypothetical protein
MEWRQHLEMFKTLTGDNIMTDTKIKKLVICVDFDGTCVKHAYPKIGAEIGAVPVLKALVAEGHRLVLFTMRSGTFLDEAVNWFEENDIELYGANTNPQQKHWTDSPKAFGNLYIDDAALGAPLTSGDITDRPFINWSEVESELRYRGLIK